MLFLYLRKLASTWFFNLSCISKCFRKHWISKSVESFRNHFMCDLFHLWFIEKKISLAACFPITLRNVFPGGISFVLPRYLQPITSPFHQEQNDLNRVWSIASKTNFQWTISDTVVVLFYTCSSTEQTRANTICSIEWISTWPIVSFHHFDCWANESAAKMWRGLDRQFLFWAALFFLIFIIDF